MWVLRKLAIRCKRCHELPILRVDVISISVVRRTWLQKQYVLNYPLAIDDNPRFLVCRGKFLLDNAPATAIINQFLDLVTGPYTFFV